MWIFDSLHYITFGAGGVRGFAHIGAIIMLDQAFRHKGKDLYKQLKGCSGASIGAMMAFLMVVGCREKRLIKETLHVPIHELFDNPIWQNMSTMYGLISNQVMRKHVFDIIERYTGDGHITFRRLYEITGKQLIISVTNVSTESHNELHGTFQTPDYNVLDSLIASMSIPILFPPVIIKGELMVDGALTNGLPYNNWNPEETLLIRIYNISPEVDSFKSYFIRVIMMLIRSGENQLESFFPFQDHVLRLHMREMPIDIQISHRDKKNMMERGARYMARYLNPELLQRKCIELVTKCLLFAAVTKPTHETKPVSETKPTHETKPIHEIKTNEIKQDGLHDLKTVNYQRFEAE